MGEPRATAARSSTSHTTTGDLAWPAKITSNRDQFSREIRWLISKADADPWEWERQGLREFLRGLSAALTPMERYYKVWRMKVPINQPSSADAVHWARAQ